MGRRSSRLCAVVAFVAGALIAVASLRIVVLKVEPESCLELAPGAPCHFEPAR